jgi:ribonuclease BN (tRNA processing enzyme)
MIVTVLGGSAAGPNTGAGTAGFLVTHGATSIVLDLGSGTLLELRKHLDFRLVTAVVISHYHLDHMLDLGALRYSLAYNPVPPDRKPALLIPPGSFDRFALWAEAFGHEPGVTFFSEYFDVTEYDPVVGITLPDIDIAMAPTVHEAQGWAMRLKAVDGRSLGYTADTGPAANLAEHFDGVNLLISEATEADSIDDLDPRRGHLRAVEAGQLASAAHAKALMLTHVWEEDDRAAVMALAATAFDGPIIDARPGTRVCP